MILQRTDLEAIDGHWAVSAVGAEFRKRAHDVANARLLNAVLADHLTLDFVFAPGDIELLERLATAYEVAASEGLDALLGTGADKDGLGTAAQAGAFRAFGIRRVTPIPSGDLHRVFHVLHLVALAYAGDRWADLRRWLVERRAAIEVPDVADRPWDERVLFRVYDAWVRLCRKDSWDDVHHVSEIIADLRTEQHEYESGLLDNDDNAERTFSALRLVALYHWAKATEMLAEYMLQGDPPGIVEQLGLHFEKAVSASAAIGDIPLEMLLRWLHVASRRMVAGSLWAATAGINSRVTRFVRSVTRAAHPLIELLPPQRAALAEQGLLDPASRAVIVDLPTSGGKTALAQFRILQALNQFADDGGWIAYLAPTRALVAQLARRLRRDFGPLDIIVEQVSGGVEIDTFEQQLLDENHGFDVLVSTPEKLSLIIRSGKLQHRPLVLVVVDEAHNIEDADRGLRVELLLATVRQDCPRANYLLLMPFVPQADVLARWLDPENGKTVSLGTTAWQPNERVVGLFSLVELPSEERRARTAWALDFETLTTTPGTIHIKGTHRAGGENPLNLRINEARQLMKMTTAMAKIFSARGTSVAVGDTIPHVWSMARAAAANIDLPAHQADEVQLVKRFLQTEVGDDFELVSLLDRGVAVHHAGLPDEARSLVEWLAEEGHLRVLCATTTIAQGINFPVASVFLSRVEHPTRRQPVPMSPREFWNLAGRAGRVGQDTVGVVGIAANTDEKARYLREFVGRATSELASRLVALVGAIVGLSPENQLRAVVRDEQWADFRCFVAHMLHEAENLTSLQSQTELLLRNTLGFTALRGKGDHSGAETLLAVTNAYAERLSKNAGVVTLADATGFDPEGVRTAIAELDRLPIRLSSADWESSSLFGDGAGLGHLVGIMMKLPMLNRALQELAGRGDDRHRVAEIARAWVGGATIQRIAQDYFTGGTTTDNISNACKGISRALVNSGVWGLAGLSRLPGSGIDWDGLSDDERRRLNLVPAFLYHGVDTEDAVLMRISQVPRSVAKSLGEKMRAEAGHARPLNIREAREFVRSQLPAAWDSVAPDGSKLSGAEYRDVWRRLAGEG